MRPIFDLVIIPTKNAQYLSVNRFTLLADLFIHKLFKRMPDALTLSQVAQHELLSIFELRLIELRLRCHLRFGQVAGDLSDQVSFRYHVGVFLI